MNLLMNWSLITAIMVPVSRSMCYNVSSILGSRKTVWTIFSNKCMTNLGCTAFTINWYPWPNLAPLVLFLVEDPPLYSNWHVAGDSVEFSSLVAYIILLLSSLKERERERATGPAIIVISNYTATFCYGSKQLSLKWSLQKKDLASSCHLPTGPLHLVNPPMIQPLHSWGSWKCSHHQGFI